MFHFKTIIVSGLSLAMGLSAVTSEADGKRIPATSRQEFASAYDLTGIKGPDPLPAWQPPQDRGLSSPNITPYIQRWVTIYQSTPDPTPGCIGYSGASFKWPSFATVYNQPLSIDTTPIVTPYNALIATGRVRIAYTTQVSIARNYDLAYVALACQTSADGITYGSCNTQAQNGPSLMRNNQVTNNQIFTTYSTSFFPPSSSFYLKLGLGWNTGVSSVVPTGNGCFNNLVVEAEYDEYFNINP
ncbi:MAG: hypothetical protein RLZZ09_1186 [Pseudomonadota bacterium]|jgi:hypothetical protein